MSASLMSIPYELREQIIQPLVRTPGTVGLQYPLWADKSVFVPPISQVCKCLRKEAVEVFYRTNVFVWKIDPEAVRPAGALIDAADPAAFPLEPPQNCPKEYGPCGPLISSLPWQYPDMLFNLRRLRLNLYLPPQHDLTMWSERFSKQLSSFTEAIDQGTRLRDFKILIGTWHGIRELGAPQMAAFHLLAQMEVRGTVQVRTRSLDARGRAVVQGLDLERRLRALGSIESPLEESKAERRLLDWEWDGGTTI